MNLNNYYYYFKSTLTPKFCQDIIDYGKQHKPEMAVTGGVNMGDDNHKADGSLKKRKKGLLSQEQKKKINIEI